MIFSRCLNGVLCACAPFWMRAGNKNRLSIVVSFMLLIRQCRVKRTLHFSKPMIQFFFCLLYFIVHTQTRLFEWPFSILVLAIICLQLQLIGQLFAWTFTWRKHYTAYRITCNILIVYIGIKMFQIYILGSFCLVTFQLHWFDKSEKCVQINIFSSQHSTTTDGKMPFLMDAN